TSAEALWYLAWVELRAGRWSLAAECADRAQEIFHQYGIELPQDSLPIALIAAHRGELERARSAGRRWSELADAQPPLLPAGNAVFGSLDLWSGNAAAAAESFAIAEVKATALGWGEPNLRFWRAEYTEALLELGRMDDAEQLLLDWEAGAIRTGRQWVLAHVLRGRGLAAAAGGAIE